MPAPSLSQRIASDPASSIWVNANAGSGKTTVLTNRVVRLLLAGADPAKILCVTFTKAAAANMQDRIFKLLGAWVAMEQADLSAAIAEMTGEAADVAALRTARRLFARALETPGGLKIQTIHAFAERLLHQFPFEAGVPPRFSALEDAEARDAEERPFRHMLRTALGAGETSPLCQALTLVVREVDAERLRADLFAMVAMLRQPSEEAPEQKFAGSALRARLGVGPHETVADVAFRVADECLLTDRLEEIAGWLDGGKKTDVERATSLRNCKDFLQNPHPEPVEGSRILDRRHAAASPLRQAQGEAAGSIDRPNKGLASYRLIFLTKESEARQTLATKDLREARPDLAMLLHDEQQRLLDLERHLRAVAAVERTEALRLLARVVLDAYEDEKQRLGKLDFTDLIDRTVRLLQSDAAAWIRFKLDAGLDHVLVDEAQDTNPAQWAIIKALTDDFYAGAGARGLKPRTVFAVGDEKQSIYSFQGARPEAFKAARQHYEAQISRYNQAAEPALSFTRVPLITSYRTVPDVLSFVDHVFSAPDRFAGLESEAKPTEHGANRMRAPGLVELWDLIRPEKTPIRDAAAPVDSLPAANPYRQMARRIARTIRHWLSTGERLQDGGRRISPGDILILVRSRGPVFRAVIQALRTEGIPFAGADRMRLTEEMIVQDLLALGRVCLQLEDDLSLAALLRSPFFGMAEEAVFACAHDRGDVALVTALGSRHPEHHATLMRWRDLALRLDPFAFYAQILGREGGRRMLLARLGSEAAEALDVFMARLMQWQAVHPPSLHQFLEAMQKDDAEVKRDLDDGHGRVRVMTVHGSKGLEAPIVFLADLCGAAVEASKGPRILDIEDTRADLAIWLPRKADDPEHVQGARARLAQRAQDESRRLLYVAMTRAMDRLYMTPATGVKGPAQDSWYVLLDAAAASASPAFVDTRDVLNEVNVRRWSSFPAIVDKRAQDMAQPVPPVTPSWLMTPASVDPERRPPLRPSHLLDGAEAVPVTETLSVRAQARLRGEAIHLLLQHMPECQPERRAEVGEHLIAARFPRMEGGSARAALDEALRLIADPALQHVFTGDARVEAALAGTLDVNGRRETVSGRVDRLVLGDSTVVLVDYKTGAPPHVSGTIPEATALQMRTYAALLGNIYPQKTIRAYVIWTQIPAAVEVPLA